MAKRQEELDIAQRVTERNSVAKPEVISKLQVTCSISLMTVTVGHVCLRTRMIRNRQQGWWKGRSSGTNEHTLPCFYQSGKVGLTHRTLAHSNQNSKPHTVHTSMRTENRKGSRSDQLGKSTISSTSQHQATGLGADSRRMRIHAIPARSFSKTNVPRGVQEGCKRAEQGQVRNKLFRKQQKYE